MKKIFTFASLSVLILSCRTNNVTVSNINEISGASKSYSEKQEVAGASKILHYKKKIIKFHGVDSMKNLNLELSSEDNFDTVSLTYTLNGEYENVILKRVPSASGMDFLSNDKKYEVFCKYGEEGIAVIKGTEYKIKEVK